MESPQQLQQQQIEAMIAIKDLHYPFPEYAVATGIPYLHTETGLKQIRKKKVVLRHYNNSNNGNDSDNKLEVVAIVGRSFALVPNELVEEMTEKAVTAYGLTMLTKRKDRYENTIRIDLLSERKAEVKVGDIVQFGVSVRNSIDGSSSLAVDLFSYRLRCKNGATARDPSISFTARHIGDPRELVKEFHKALATVIEHIDTLLNLYRRMTEIRLTKEGAEKLIRLGFPEKYYKYTPILIRTNGSIELKYEGETLWDTFNAITNVVTHESRAAPIARSYMTHRLHRVMQELVTTTN
ncbi:MAG: DUF932 domain-containing protein [Candidatus Nitrosocaldaceae archaeon]